MSTTTPNERIEDMNAGKLTRLQAAIVGAYTGVLCGPLPDLHSYIEQIMGRPVWTHEMGDEQIAEQIKEAAKEDFLSICAPGTRF